MFLLALCDIEYGFEPLAIGQVSYTVHYIKRIAFTKIIHIKDSSPNAVPSTGTLSVPIAISPLQAKCMKWKIQSMSCPPGSQDGADDAAVAGRKGRLLQRAHQASRLSHNAELKVT